MRMLFGASAAMAEDPAAIASATKEIRPSKVSMNSLPCDAPGAIAYRHVHHPGRRPRDTRRDGAGVHFRVVFPRWQGRRSARPAFPADRSERIGARLILDRHPLPLGEFLPVGGTADSCAVARGADAAERNVRLIGDGLVVDVQKPGVEPIADRNRTSDI